MPRHAALFAMVAEIGGLVLFWGLGAMGLGRYAAPATIAFVVLDALRRRVTGAGWPRVWGLFSGLALSLAVLDLLAAGAAWSAYEGVIGNALIAGVFAVGALWRTPLVQAIAEARQGAAFADTSRDLRVFFRAYTIVWALYFALRALVWLWLLEALPPRRAGAIEQVAGPVSLGLMILISFRGPALFRLVRRAGLLALPV